MSGARLRRPTSWAIVELTRLGERKAEDGTLEPLLRDALSLPYDHPIFVPCRSFTAGGRRTTIHLMEGYAFAGSDGRALSSPSRTDQPYIKRLLTSPSPSGGRVLSVLPDSRILEMEADLARHVGEDAKLGTEVSVTKGLYAKMEGQVVEILESGDLVVRFRMRSLDLIAKVPKSLVVPSNGS